MSDEIGHARDKMPSSKKDAMNIIARQLAFSDNKGKDYYDAFEAYHTAGKGKENSADNPVYWKYQNTAAAVIGSLCMADYWIAPVEMTEHMFRAGIGIKEDKKRWETYLSDFWYFEHVDLE